MPAELDFIGFVEHLSVRQLLKSRLYTYSIRPPPQCVQTLNQQIVVSELPKGKLSLDHFRLIEGPVPTPAAEEVLVRVKLLHVDAAMRAWLRGRTYREAVAIGDVMPAAALCEVMKSRSTLFQPGDLVHAANAGCQEFATLHAGALLPVEAIEPVSHSASVFGTAGLTAYFGLLCVGRPTPGQTVLVSAAAGAVGSLVGQIARILGCRAVGIAGSQAKCDSLVDELGFDAAVNYKAGDLRESIFASCPNGVDVFFDNVGGAVFEAGMFNMNRGGRMVACGSVSSYDSDASVPQSVRGVPAVITARRLTLSGFIVSDFFVGDARARAIELLRKWVESGQLKVKEDIVDGLRNLPAALIGLLEGDNVGKRLVRVS